MPINYSCFISYPHSDQNDLLESLIKQLTKALSDQIGLSIRKKVYLDEERLKPGYGLNKSLGRAICESVCMIVVYSPLYQDSDYCLWEFLAMEEIEKKRAQILGEDYINEKRMIIPIICREPPRQRPLPKKIRNIKYWNISKYLLIGFDLGTIPECKQMISDIANFIVDHYDKIRECKETWDNIDCDSSYYGSVEEAMINWESVSTSEIGFPGRSNI
jgi:hypothetical protein